MAERIQTLIMSRARKYPWDQWADGSAWRIQRGVDYEIPSTSMAAMIRERAKSDGHVATARVVDSDAVEFQFRRKPNGADKPLAVAS